MVNPNAINNTAFPLTPLTAKFPWFWYRRQTMRKPKAPTNVFTMFFTILYTKMFEIHSLFFGVYSRLELMNFPKHQKEIPNPEQGKKYPAYAGHQAVLVAFNRYRNLLYHCIHPKCNSFRLLCLRKIPDSNSFVHILKFIIKNMSILLDCCICYLLSRCYRGAINWLLSTVINHGLSR